ncbi:glycosyltransferase family 2 protein [Pseudooceanicola nanhaiensis]|uniref:glycosyltransferase family 2 protein n=1 Tax=Pseudooceanicola nanhaiensis TaxID=375761 RepID=UPI001CD24E70|nr:glycosyltransferase family 2 protein [Pseudooceanicola nanhaiensis]MCA0918751.1 glycosyltransferase family 2 protein [Pseudooceanicola nanhaiensis]
MPIATKPFDSVANKVTTIIPCFNDSASLRRSVQSVQSQPCASRIVIVDDGSDPAHAAEIGRIAAEFDATAIRLDERRGPAAARNAGLDICRTPYVAFLDADDVWLPGKLAAQLSEMEARALSFSYMRYANVCRGRAKVMPAPQSLSRAELLRNTAIGCSTVMVARAFIGERRFVEAECEDLAFWAILLDGAQRAYRIGTEPMVLRHLGGRSRHRGRAALHYWRTLRGPLRLPPGEATRNFVSYAGRAMWKHWVPTGRTDARLAALGPVS